MNILTTLAYEILSENGYPVEQNEEGEGSVQGLISLDKGTYRFQFTSGAKGQDFTLFLCMPEYIPEPHRYAVMELVTRINYRLAVGHFEMDLDDGDVRFVHRQLTEGNQPGSELLLTLMRIGLHVVETWYPGIQRIVEDGWHPQAVLAEVDEATGQSLADHARFPSYRIN